VADSYMTRVGRWIELNMNLSRTLSIRDRGFYVAVDSILSEWPYVKHRPLTAPTELSLSPAGRDRWAPPPGWVMATRFMATIQNPTSCQRQLAPKVQKATFCLQPFGCLKKKSGLLFGLVGETGFEPATLCSQSSPGHFRNLLKIRHKP
jgi:hypothetical protein